MSEGLLRNRHILVVEDEYFIADALQHALESAGAVVVGPAPSVDDALALLGTTLVDGAVLDVNLDNEGVFPVAEALAARAIPFVFATGYSASDLPPEWRHVPRYEKPADPAAVAHALVAAEFL